MWKPSYWTLPLISAVVWLAMLLTMFIVWVTDGKPIYVSMQPEQTIPYISDVGADRLKPLFVSMGAFSVVTFDLAFIADRWLRHTGKLVQNTSTFQKILSIVSIIAAVVGAAGLILLSVFDTKRHMRIHNIFLALFIGGYIISAVFTCWQYQRLGMHFRERPVLRYSFWVKLAFILLEVALAIAFGVLNRRKMWNTAAIVEWVIALIYSVYVFSFFIDFLPSARADRHTTGGKPQIESEMIEEGVERPGRYYGNGATNGHVNGHTNGHTNGHAFRPSRNF